MPSLRTARLLNSRGRITLHVCVRLEIRPVLRSRGICPIFKCVENGSERVFGCLDTKGSRRLLKKLYPGIPIEDVTMYTADPLVETIDYLRVEPDTIDGAATEIAA